MEPNPYQSPQVPSRQPLDDALRAILLVVELVVVFACSLGTIAGAWNLYFGQ
jgi:hypothetical protein